MPRILFVSHSSTWGGAEKCLALLLEGLPQDKFRPTVLMRRRPFSFANRGALETHCRRRGLDVHLAPLKWWVRDWRHDRAFVHGLPRRVERIADLVRRERIDLVMTNTSAVCEGALAARATGVPHVWHVLELLGRDPVLRPFLPLGEFFGLVGELSRKIVVVSQCVADEVAAFCPQAKIAVVHTGLPQPPAAALPADKSSRQSLFGVSEDTAVVVFVGLLSERKGPLDLVEAARQVVARQPRTLFLLVGRDGGQRRAIERCIELRGLRDHVRLLGHRDDVPAILQASDLLVLPALADSLPVAVLEAMSVGLPVVATRSGGCEEMIVDGQTGRLVAARDPPAFAAAILDVLGDPLRRRAMGQSARERFAAMFTQTAYVENFARVFDAVLSDASTHRPWPQDVGPLVARLTTAAIARRDSVFARAPIAARLRERMITLAYRLGIIG